MARAICIQFDLRLTFKQVLALAIWTAAALLSTPRFALGQSLAPTFTIRGTLINGIDQRPIPNAEIALDQSQPTARSTHTDDQGRFVFNNVPLGFRSVQASKPGYTCPPPQHSQHSNCLAFADIQANDTSGDTDIRLTLDPLSEITGTVRDPSGKPIKRLGLRLQDMQLRDGLTTWISVGGSYETDANGSFHLRYLWPRTYRLCTRDAVDWEARQRDPMLSVDHGYPSTCYSGTPGGTIAGVLGAATAKPFVLKAGDRIQADLTVAEQKFQLVTIPYSASGDYMAGDEFAIYSAESDPESGLHPRWDPPHHLIHVYAPAGSYLLDFMLHPVYPSRELAAQASPKDSNKVLRGTAKFTVTDQPVTLPAVPTQESVSIPVHVHTQYTKQKSYDESYDPSRDFSPERGHQPGLRLYLSWARHESIHIDPRNFRERIEWVSRHADAKLAFRGVPPGEYTLKTSAARGTYVSSLTCGNQDLLRANLVISPKSLPCAVEAVVSDSGPSLRLKLAPRAVARLARLKIDQISVAVIPLGSIEPAHIYEPDIKDGALSGSELESPLILAPGKYLALITYDRWRGPYRDPLALKDLLKKGKVFTLHPGQEKTVHLDWKP